MNKNIFDDSGRLILNVLAAVVFLIIILASMYNRYQFEIEIQQNETEIHLKLTPPEEEPKRIDEIKQSE